MKQPIINNRNILNDSIHQAEQLNKPLYIIIIATKPCYIKLASLVHSFTKQQIPYILIDSNQHYDDDLKTQIHELDYNHMVSVNLNVYGNNFNDKMISLASSFNELLEILQPYRKKIQFIPMVSGDTFTAALIPQLFYYSLGVKSIHIEAGLRSSGPSVHEKWDYEKLEQQTEFDWVSFPNDPFPEGMDTRLASQCSQILLAPILRNQTNLISEGYDKKNIEIVGSLSSDAVSIAINKIKKGSFLIRHPYLKDKKWLRVDIHRRENLQRNRLNAILIGLLKLREDGFNILMVRSNAFDFAIEQFEMKQLIEKLKASGIVFTSLWSSYIDVIDFITSENCFGIYTDSGGLQEEAHILGVPCFTARFSTDRPETIIESKTNLLVPPISELFIYKSFQNIREKGVKYYLKDLGKVNLYGENVGEKIGGILKKQPLFEDFKKDMLCY